MKKKSNFLQLNRFVVGCSFIGFASSVHPFLSAFAANSLEMKCSGKVSIAGDNLQNILAEVSMANLQTRTALITMMREKDNSCRKALEARLVEIKEKPSNFKNNTGRHAALTLGLLLDLPAALQIVESEAAISGAPEWLAMLQQWDEKAYAELLQKWVVAAGDKLRFELGLQSVGKNTYGKTLIEERSQSGKKNQLAPFVLELYLKSALQREPSASEFAAINIHYAAADAASRRLFRENFASILRKNSVSWVNSFRDERAWTQFQMIDLMASIGGSEMVRELLWLSQNHMDERMKSRASQALDDALKIR